MTVNQIKGKENGKNSETIVNTTYVVVMLRTLTKLNIDFYANFYRRYGKNAGLQLHLSRHYVRDDHYTSASLTIRSYVLHEQNEKLFLCLTSHFTNSLKECIDLYLENTFPKVSSINLTSS